MGYQRFVALGDSFTEGLDDPRPDGSYRGWADLVADTLAGVEPTFRYANLAVRSLRMDTVVDEQVPSALQMQPDLVSIAAGGNDLLGVRADVDAIAARLDTALESLTRSGATVVTFTGFDPRHHLPPGRLIARRTAAFNALVRASAQRHGALLVDLWRSRELVDRRLWSADRLHLSPDGHRFVATTVLDLLRLGSPAIADADRSPVASPRPDWRAGLRRDLAWARDYFAPWVVRKVRNRPMGHGMTAKYADLEAWTPRPS